MTVFCRAALVFAMLVPFAGAEVAGEPNGALPAAASAQTENIYIALFYSPYKTDKAQVTAALKSIGATASGTLLKYTNATQHKNYVIHFVESFAALTQALYTADAHIVIKGHSNFGMGGVIATPAETYAQTIAAIRCIDDDRILTYSSPWISVNVPKFLSHQSYPNWWPVFKDGTSGIMPYDFGDPRGAPPYNYCLTYQVPGDPTFYKVETVRNSALERFPDSGQPAWYSPDGIGPDPTDPASRQYYMLNTNTSTEVTGRWLQDSFDANGSSSSWGNHYLCLPAGKGLNRVEWRFTVPAPATYSVCARWRPTKKNVTKAAYTVTHALGSTVVTVNQTLHVSEWVQLGQFSFNADTYTVALTDAATPSGANVVADAIRVTGSPATGPFDQTIGNLNSPKTHLRSKTVIYRKNLEVDPSKFRYTRMFYDGCNSGTYYIDTFHRGLMFYTVNDSDMTAFNAYLDRYLKGRSNLEIWAAMQKFEAVYDFYDFNKTPADQDSGTAALPAAISAPAAAASKNKWGRLPVPLAFAALKQPEIFVDDDLSRQAILAMVADRKEEAVARALDGLARPLAGNLPGGTPYSHMDDFVVARRVLEAFPDVSVAHLLDLYAGGDAVTRGNVVRAAGGILGAGAIDAMLVAALDDKDTCDAEGRDDLGAPLRVCDVAYNQLILRYQVRQALRTLAPMHAIETREYHIGLLRKAL